MIKLFILLRPYARYLLIAWVVTILIVSSIPSIPPLKIHTEKADIRLDYLIHVLEYGALTLFSLLTFTGDKYKMDYRKISVITLSLVLFAILDEYHQKIIPGRTYNINDIFGNVLGIFVALIICTLVFRKIEAKIDIGEDSVG